MIEARALKKSFGRHQILDGVSFCIEKGESAVIIGRSGGGKSVLLKHLIGLLRPDAGEILIEGEDIGPMSERQLKLINRLLDGFEGKLTSSNWASIAKCSPDTALRDISELIDLGVLRKTPGGGRSTAYELKVD